MFVAIVRRDHDVRPCAKKRVFSSNFTPRLLCHRSILTFSRRRTLFDSTKEIVKDVATAFHLQLNRSGFSLDGYKRSDHALKKTKAWATELRLSFSGSFEAPFVKRGDYTRRPP